MWLAYVLTLCRIPLAGVFWAVYDRPVWAAAVVAIAAISDGLDGWVARRARPGGSAIGGWLDPLADKLFVVGALVAVYVHEHPPALLVVLIGARELLMPALFVGYLVVARGRRPALRAAPLGKVATVVQFAAVLALVGDSPGVWVLAVLAAAAGVAACGQYVVHTIRQP